MLRGVRGVILKGMEREILMTGIGGQGIQLAARVLAEAALAEGREVMLFGSYGGMMRGGRTDTAVVIADDLVEAPPVVPDAWAAMVMHHEFAAPIWAKLRPEGVALLNSAAAQSRPEHAAAVVEVPATDLAVDAGSVVAGSMVLLGALAATTGLVGLESLKAAVGRCLPAYRRQLVGVNMVALDAGHGAVPAGSHPAWKQPVAS